jgi:hypothetical protein
MTRLTLGLRAACVALALSGALAGLAGGCSDTKTVIFVSVTGDATGISQLKVVLATAGLSTTFFIPSPPPKELFSLPTSFTVEMDRSRQGDLTVDIEAQDAAGKKLAGGSGILTNIDVGHRNEMDVALTTETPPAGGDDGGVPGGDDGGTDAASGDVPAETHVDGDGGAPEVVAADAGDETGPDGGDDGGVDADADDDATSPP